MNLARNRLVPVSEWMKAPREDLKVGDIIDGKSLVELHTDNDKNLSMKVADFSGIAAIATAIKGGTKITMLDLSDNNLHAQGGRLLAEALAGIAKSLSSTCPPTG